MKRYTRLLLATCLSLASLLPIKAATPYQEAFEKGNEAYADGQYALAIEQYAAALQSGFESWEVFFNLGNAYYRSGNYPQAILYYERAALRTRTKTPIQTNLALAESKIADRFEQMPRFFATAWWNKLTEAFSPTAWAIILLGLFFLILASSCLYLLGRNYLQKKTGFFGFVFCLLLLTVGSLAAVNDYRQAKKEYAIVMCLSVEAKTSPEERSQTKFMLHEGSKVLIEDRIGTYGKIRIKNGSRAWIPMECLEKI